ncbi:ATP-dependent protease La [Minicystis rosea]|nr:ATP-dependent protease La [Minicystis rosea]
MARASQLRGAMPERLTLPVIPLRDTVLFPAVATPITAGRLKTLRAVEAALRAEGDFKYVFAVTQRDSADEPSAEGLYGVGVIARIASVQRFGAGLSLVLSSESRGTALSYSEHDGVIYAVAAPLAEVPPRPDEAPSLLALSRDVRERAIEYGRRRGAPEEVLRQFVGGIDDAAQLVNHIAFYLDLATPEKQALLETLSTEQRLRVLASHLQRQIGLVETQEKIRTSVQEELGERQRELYLREQLKAIQKELGETDDTDIAGRLESRIAAAGVPAEALAEVRRDLARLKRLGRDTSPEAQMLTTWLEWVADLPWQARTADHVDLAEARRILDADHHGLADVKDRVLEFLAVRKLRESTSDGEARSRAMARGPILLFLGPPGTGKTSVAESIARSLGRRYLRVSLGGARDEADIRGHRRTYVGAMPGRILHGMRQVKTKNPVFLLDEIDKLGVSFQGDPAAALLEVLDPAQNRTFVDHYLGLPFDLSEVLFICTANFRDQIPAPLLDRMEPILFAGYTESEKVEIARRYLLPRAIDDSGLRGAELTVEEPALRAVIGQYTREAGVRQLERAVASLGRKVARRIAGGEARAVRVETEADVRALLGRAHVPPPPARGPEEPGVATGMYYTQAGGDVMDVEASILPGRGELVLTGQLGDVMKESGRAALTYARMRARYLGVPESEMRERDFHVHVPAGAVPKDGPSAGVTMALALLSALSARPVRRDLAMTGEITLRGRVLAIGGVKEKILGAHRAGIPEVLLPRDNEGDLDEIDETVRRSMSFHLVDTLDEAIEIALRAA